MKVLLFANTDWYLYNFRLALAEAIRAAGHEVVLLSPPGKYGERLQQAGFRWLEFPLARRRLNPFAELMTILRLILVYRKERPNLVHHFTIKCVLYGSIAARLAGIQGIVNALTGLGYLFSEGCLQGCCGAGQQLACMGDETHTSHLSKSRRSARVSQAESWKRHSHLIRGSGVDMSDSNRL